MQITRTSPSPPTLQRWGSVFITNGENGRMEKLTRVSEANRVSRVSRVSTFYIYARIRARECICFGILLTLPTLLARG